MNNKRPVNLELTTISFPIAAIGSILHRISGVIVFLLTPVLVWLLQTSLHEPGFNLLKADFVNPIMKFLVWAFLATLIYHLVAGIRHLSMDILGWGETKEGGKIAAYITIISGVILMILAGVWIW